MLVKRAGDLSFYLFHNLAQRGDILHFVSTREGGVSLPPYDTLNLGFHTGDDPHRVRKNRVILSASLGIPPAHLVTAKQVHGSSVLIVTEAMRGRGALEYESALDAKDGMVTNQPNICLMILVADCVPIVIFDPRAHAIGIAHAGWKGTASSIARSVVTALREEFGSAPADIVAGIGPAIGPCCYAVGREVIEAFEDSSIKHAEGIVWEQGDGSVYLDLLKANKGQLMAEGIPEGNIETAGICTCHSTESFFSYRKEGVTGRFGIGIMLRE